MSRLLINGCYVKINGCYLNIGPLCPECDFQLIASGESTFGTPDSVTLTFDVPDYSGSFANLWLFVYMIDPSVPTYTSGGGSEDVGTLFTASAEQVQDTAPTGYLIKADAVITDGLLAQTLTIAGGNPSSRIIAALFATSAAFVEKQSANSGASLVSTISTTFATAPTSPGFVLSVAVAQLSDYWLSDGPSTNQQGSPSTASLSWTLWDTTLPTVVTWNAQSGTDRPLVWSLSFTCDPIPE